jgi:ribonucleotide reductase alpha subunit
MSVNLMVKLVVFLKYLKVVNEALRFWNQRGKKPGSCAVYIEPWHKDILTF